MKYWFEDTSWKHNADYILVTGALWKDRIDRIDVYVDFPKPAAFPQIEASPGNYYYNGGGIEWHFESIEPDFNLLVSCTEYPSAFRLTDECYQPRQADPNDKYRWDDHFYSIDFAPYDYEMHIEKDASGRNDASAGDNPQNSDGTDRAGSKAKPDSAADTADPQINSETGSNRDIEERSGNSMGASEPGTTEKLLNVLLMIAIPLSLILAGVCIYMLNIRKHAAGKKG